MPIPILPPGASHNINIQALATPIEDEFGDYISLYGASLEIMKMDTSAELRTGHCAGLLAAQLTLNYLDRTLHPVHERAIDMGMLAMLGLYITEKAPLTSAEIHHADTYQRSILFARVLDSLEPETMCVNREYTSITLLEQRHIRYNLFGYLSGRVEFSEITGDIVEEYRESIRSTPPIGEDITQCRNDDTLRATVDRFLQVRHALQDYIPTLVELDEELWRYARTHYLRYLK